MKSSVCAALAVLAAGCDQPETGHRRPKPETVSPISLRLLDATEAAGLACQLANDRCEQEWRKRPFVPSTFQARFEKGRWVWGRYTPAGPQGFSAVVSFDRGGRLPSVQLYFSTDIAVPQRQPWDLVPPNGKGPRLHDLERAAPPSAPGDILQRK